MPVATRLRGQKRVATPGAFVPTDIAGLVAWWDFSDIASLWKDTGRTSAVTVDGDAIQGVTDKSLGGIHLSEATNPPTYKTGIQAGKSVARFDGTNDTLAAVGITADVSFTVLIVALKRSVPISVNKALWTAASSATLYTNSALDATHYLWASNQAGGVAVMPGTAASWGIQVIRVNSASSLDAYANGGTATNFDPNNTITTATVTRLGSNTTPANFGDFDVAEVLRYDSALSATDLNRIGPYLDTKWGITWTTAT